MTNRQSKDENSNRRVTMRDIAREVGCSHVAVSKALRGLRGVSAKTKAQILEKAKEMGYVQDPLLTVLSHYRRSSKTKPVQAELAWINLWKNPKSFHRYKEFDLYREGAIVGAKRFGFQLQEFNVAEIPLDRLITILKTRCIQGLLIPPLRDPVAADLTQFPWSDFVTVNFGRTIPYPKTHFVSSAQTANTMLAFNRTRELGYKRIGFVCEFNAARLFGAGFSWAQKQCPPDQQIPLLTLNINDSEQKRQQVLALWLKQCRPDAILTDHAIMPHMLKTLGIRIPEDIGLATTSIHDTPINAGIDQKSDEIGRAAVRNLVALMAENSFGIPETRNEILIDGKWIDGSMMPCRDEPREV